VDTGTASAVRLSLLAESKRDRGRAHRWTLPRANSSKCRSARALVVASLSPDRGLPAASSPRRISSLWPTGESACERHVPLRSTRGEPLVDFRLNPGDAAITKRDWLRKLASPNLSPQVITTIPNAFLWLELVEGDDFQRDSSGQGMA